MSTEVLIELDSAAPEPRIANRPPAHRYRVIGLAVAVILLLGLAGATPSSTPALRRAGIVTAVRDGTVFRLLGDRLYVSVAAGPERITSGYAMHPFRLLWSARTPDQDQAGQMEAAEGGIIVRTRNRTDVLDAGTGRVRWNPTMPLQVLPGGRTALTQEPWFRPGSEYDESSGDPGMLYYAADGEPYTRPPDRTVLRGIDLANGAQRWSLTLPGAIYAAPPTAGPATVLVVSSQQLQLLDADTGVARHTQPMPAGPANASASVDIAGGLIRLYRADGQSVLVSAFDLDTLRPLWQRPVQDGAGNTDVCVGVACEPAPDNLRVLDPATGAVRWETAGSVSLIVRGGYVFEAEGVDSEARPVRAVNPATGAPRADLTGWLSVAAGSDDSPLLLTRPVGYGTAFGVLLPGQSAVREVGRSELPLDGCRSTAELVACSSAMGVEVFTHRG